MYNFEEILSRKNNGSKKWNSVYIQKRFPNHKKEIFPLFIADMDYKLPFEIMNEFKAFIESGDFGYFDLDDAFYESIINWHKKISHCEILREDIITGTGTVSILGTALRATLNKNDKVVVFTPSYGPFKEIVELNDFEICLQDLVNINHRYEINFEELENQFKNGVKAMLLCNPHNPSGRVWEKEVIDRLVNLASIYNVYIFSDEVHSDLTLDENKFVSLAKYFEVYDGIVIATSPNKTFNLAGVSASYLLVRNHKFKDLIEQVMKKERIEINRIGANYIKTCYNNGELWLYQLRKVMKENIELLKENFKDLDVEIMDVEAGYLVWVKLNKVNDNYRFVVELAEKTGVLVETGERFIDNYDGFIRINVATSKEILKEAFYNFRNFYKNY